MSHLSMWAFDEVVDRVVERLTPLYLTAAKTGTFINLDMEEYRDLDLTIAVFTRILEDQRLQLLEAGIVLQAYLPDALGAMRELTAWAKDRVMHGGAAIKVRLVKGANLPMEKVDAVMHGWPLATYDTKLDSDANYLRVLDEALRPENAAAVRVGIAGHNLFGIAYSWLLAGERDVRSQIEFEMLLGMAQGQVQAVSREVGHVLLYVPVVKPEEFDVAISYLVRRLEENAEQDNFLSAAFHLHDDESLFARERDRFLGALERAGDRTTRTTSTLRTVPADPGARIASALRAGRGRRRRPHSGRARHRTRIRGGSRRRCVRRDSRVLAPRGGGGLRRCARLPQHSRQRPRPSREPRVGARHPLAHRDVDRRRRDSPGRPRRR
jgi:RHH-type proline utilization regulon transcriptional repressor/proline dehydrogenase/delta 1-pyrroline-5-carboxylate dehydrogenase